MLSTLATLTSDVTVIDPVTCQPMQASSAVLSTGAIVGIALGCVAFSTLVVVTIVLLTRWRQASFTKVKNAEIRARNLVQMQHFAIQ